MITNPADIPVFVLCGGLGTRLREETVLVPKPMIQIGTRPILWHIMRTYANYGFKKFVLCLGYRSEIIKSYFLNYTSMNSDFTVMLKTNDVQVHSIDHEQDWQVTLAYTGELTMTGARIAQAAMKYLGNARHFAITYGDGLTDANLRDELMFHESHRRVATVLGVNPPSRFGQFKLDSDDVVKFEEKPAFTNDWINGGYMFVRREFLMYLSEDESCVLEKTPLTCVADDGQLRLYKHTGFWACMDTQRDLDYLNQIWSTGHAPWSIPASSSHIVANEPTIYSGELATSRVDH